MCYSLEVSKHRATNQMIYIEATNGGTYTLNTGDLLNLDGQKGVKKLTQGRYEVSLAVLKRLKTAYNIYPSASSALQALKAKA